jgi:hypothetical protein
MATRTFYAETIEEALEAAEAYLKTLDPYEQGSLQAHGLSWEGTAYAVVHSFGLD